MRELRILEELGSVSLTVSGLDGDARTLAHERLSEIEGLVRSVLEFDEIVSTLSETELARLQAALAAMDLKYQAMLHGMSLHLEAAQKVAKGTESIAEHGFPEFHLE